MTKQFASVETNALNVFEAYAAAAAGNRIEGKLLRFSKFGEYVAGEDEKIPLGTELIAEMASLATGWTKWVDGKPVEQAFGRVLDGFKPPRRQELGDTDEALWPTDDNNNPKDPWRFQNRLVLHSKDGEEVYTFTTGSRGGINAIAELSGKYGRHVRKNPGALPLIALDSGSYQHGNKAFGEIRYPIFRIVGWINTEADALPIAPPETAAEEMEDVIPF
jgi:hypothetical protein